MTDVLSSQLSGKQERSKIRELIRELEELQSEMLSLW
jgi:hypothetical protein